MVILQFQTTYLKVTLYEPTLLYLCVIIKNCSVVSEKENSECCYINNKLRKTCKYFDFLMKISLGAVVLCSRKYLKYGFLEYILTKVMVYIKPIFIIFQIKDDNKYVIYG